MGNEWENGGSTYYCASFPDALDLASFTREQAAVVRELIDGAANHRAAETNDSLHYLPRLASLSLPRYRLPINDLLAIRKDGLFDEWQVAIKRALQTIESVDESRLLDPAAFERRQIEESLQLAAEGVRDLTDNSSTLRCVPPGRRTSLSVARWEPSAQWAGLHGCLGRHRHVCWR